MRGPILLTGGSGFLGSHIAEQLSQAGVQVRAMVRSTSDTRFLRSLENVELFEASLEDSDRLGDAVDGTEAVIHAAALVKARREADFHRVNADGTRSLLEAAGSRGVGRVVVVSSLAAVGPSLDGKPRPQGAPPAPVTAYGRSKLAAEQLVSSFADVVHTVGIRPPVIYGPRDREVFAFFKAVQVGVLPLTGSPNAVLSTVFATDCANACVRAVHAEVESGRVLELDDGSPHTLAELIALIEASLGRRAWLRVPIPRVALHGAALATEAFGAITRRPVMLTRDKVNELRAPHWVGDGSTARRLLGWDPEVDFGSGSKMTAAWYREAGWL